MAFRGDVQAGRALVAGLGVDVLDDEPFARVRSQFAQPEIRHVVRARAAQLGLILAKGPAPDEAKAPGTRELSRQLPALRVGGKGRATDLCAAAGEDGAAGAPQAVLIQAEARLHLLRHLLRLALHRLRESALVLQAQA